MKVAALTVVALCISAVCCFPAVALARQEKEAPKPAKPEIKSVSVLGVPVGVTTEIVVFGENLTPESGRLSAPPAPTKKPDGDKDKKNDKPPPVPTPLPGVTVTLEPVTKTEGDDAKQAPQKLRAKITAAKEAVPGVYDLVLLHAGGVQTTARLALWEPAATETTFKDRPNTPAKALTLSGPFTAVTGFLENGDSPDLFRIIAAPGETWEFTILAGRVGSPLDALLRVRDARFRPVAFDAGAENRDRVLRVITGVPPADALSTNTASSRPPVAYVAPGPLFLEVGDAEGRGGPQYRYRLTARRVNP